MVREIIAEVLEIDRAAVLEGASLESDLDADSLALIQIVEGIEKSLLELGHSFTISDEELRETKTVRDAVDLVCMRTGGCDP